MKHQQVVVDYFYMVKCSFVCLMLAALGYIFLKLVQAVFWFPGYLKERQEKMIKKLEEKVKELEEAEKRNGDVEEVAAIDALPSEEKKEI